MLLKKIDFYETLGIFRCKKDLIIVKSIIFIKKSKNNCSFLKRYGRNPQIFEFLRENWRKFLSCTQNFGVLHLKM